MEKKKIGELSEGDSSGWELAHPTLEPEDDTPPSLDGRTRGQLGGLAGDLPWRLGLLYFHQKNSKKIRDSPSNRIFRRILKY